MPEDPSEIALARWQGGIDQKLTNIVTGLDEANKGLHDVTKLIGDFHVNIAELRRDHKEMRADLDEARAKILNEEKIGQMIGAALTSASARGWTIRDRILQYSLGFLTITSILVGVYVASRG